MERGGFLRLAVNQIKAPMQTPLHSPCPPAHSSRPFAFLSPKGNYGNFSSISKDNNIVC